MLKSRRFVEFLAYFDIAEYTNVKLSTAWGWKNGAFIMILKFYIGYFLAISQIFRQYARFLLVSAPATILEQFDSGMRYAIIG